MYHDLNQEKVTLTTEEHATKNNWGRWHGRGEVRQT
jgi:hypothetical protein